MKEINVIDTYMTNCLRTRFRVPQHKQIHTRTIQPCTIFKTIRLFSVWFPIPYILQDKCIKKTLIFKHFSQFNLRNLG